jgi:stage III sporulation protein SpoIIIAA
LIAIEMESIDRRWSPIAPVASDSCANELKLLFDTLPVELASFLQQQFAGRLPQLAEVFMQLGQPCEAIFQDVQGATERVDMGVGRCSMDHLALFATLFSAGADSVDSMINTESKRRGISQTLHRISLITHFNKAVIGVAIRVGRSFRGILQQMIGDLGLRDLGSRARNVKVDNNNYLFRY